MNTREPRAHGVEVTYRDAEPRTLTVAGDYPDGEYRHEAHYTFRMEGATAVLKTIDAGGGSYNVQMAEGAREAVRDEVAALPFVQAVEMFPEVSA